MKALALTTACLCLVTYGAAAQTETNQTNETNQIEPQAERILRSACQYLAESPFFMLRAEIWREHLNDSGEKLQFSRTVNMEVKRPGRLHVDIKSPMSDRGFWYDGSQLAILDRKRNLFSTAQMPNTLDATLDKAHDQFGIDLPLIDLAVSDPYKNATDHVIKGVSYGQSPVMGYDCYHLAFTQSNIDWQVWIQTGPQPLIRKFVITHKNEEGSPEFTALITQWDLTDRIALSDFAFEPPTGATRVEMRPDQPLAGAPTAHAVAQTPPGKH